MQRIDRSTVDRIYDVARVEEIVGDYVSLKRRGTNMLGLCPFHDEKTPSFMVSPAKGIYKCFGCGKGGNAINFVMEIEQISYYEALKQVADKYHVHIEEKELSPEEKKQFSDRDSMMVLNDFTAKYFATQLMKSAEGRAVGLSYFKQRGFSDQIIEKFQLGFAPVGKDVFVREALAKGYREEYLSKTGLATIKPDYKRDRFAGRVMFPIHGQSGKVVAFAGRTLVTDKKTAKYINSPESEVYHKSNVLYGIYLAKKEIQRKDNCFLVEGYTDVMSLHQSGIENVVASSGTSLTQGQIRLIQRFTENVTVIYDGDNAGIKASLRGIDLILEQGLNVRVLLLPDGEDPDSFAKSMGASELMDYITAHTTDFIHFKTNLLMEGTENDPIKKVKLIQEIVKSIAIIPHEIMRTVYLKECSTLLEVPEDTLLRECDNLRKKKKQDKTKETERRMSREHAQAGGVDKDGFSLPPDDLHLPPEMRSEATPATSATPVAPAEKQEPPEERMLLTFLLRYGEMKMFKEGDAYYEDYPDVLVSDYIINQLDEDELSLSVPLFKQVYDEYRRLKEAGETDIEKRMIRQDDAVISRLTVDLTTERYERSRIFDKATFIQKSENCLGDLVPRVVMEFQAHCVMREIEVNKEILKTEKDEEKLTQALMRQMELNEAKKELSKNLGHRTVFGS